MTEYWRKLLVVGILCASVLLAQTSHRELDPKSRSQPSPFEQLEKQAAESKKDDAARKATVREQRKANRSALNRELPQLIELAQNLQKQLNAADLETALPADLDRQAQRLEQAAHQIRKRVRGL